MPSCGGSSRLRDRTHVSFCLLNSQAGSLPLAVPRMLKETKVTGFFQLKSLSLEWEELQSQLCPSGLSPHGTPHSPVLASAYFFTSSFFLTPPCWMIVGSMLSPTNTSPWVISSSLGPLKKKKKVPSIKIKWLPINRHLSRELQGRLLYKGNLL